MIGDAPPFWWQQPDWRAYALWPASRLYGWVAGRRLLHAPRRPVDVPVLCVGNLTVGGTGKTPVAIAFAHAAVAMGLKPGILSRGHGGQVSAPHLVDAERDAARHVGDEPLILARHAPVAVSPDRSAGARLLLGEGCDFVIMDDGFQSASIAIDHALIVIDAGRGIGNGFTIPAGPMRAGLVDQMRYAGSLLKIGEGEAAETVVRHAARAGRPVHRARLRPQEAEAFDGRDVLAFSGIGDPAKFLRSVAEVGANIVTSRNFADHHAYSQDDARDLLNAARKAGLLLLTTAKDAARLRHGHGAIAQLHEQVQILEIAVEFENPAVPVGIIEETMRAWRLRRLKEPVAD